MDDLEEQLYHTVQSVEKGEFQFDLRDFLAGSLETGIEVALATVPGLNLAQKVIEGIGIKAGSEGPKKVFDAFNRAQKQVQTDQIQSLEQFEGRLKVLIEKHIAPKRLIVLVDDLDRCLPEKAVGVLEAIKLFMDVQGCVFVMGMDREIIAQGMRIRYDRLGEAIDGKRYLEKVVQVPFDLPPIDLDDVNHYLVSLAPDLDPRCRGVFSVGLTRPNPRRIKRMINSYVFLSLLAQARKQELGDIRLAKVVAIQHALPDLYQLLSQAPEYLADLEKFFNAERLRTRELSMPDEQSLEGLPQELHEYAASPRLRELLLHCVENEDACFRSLPGDRVLVYIRLTRSVAAPDAGLARQVVLLPELVRVPSGKFRMGTTEEEFERLLTDAARERKSQVKGLLRRELPEHIVDLSSYQIGRYPVTNRQYQAFVRATGHDLPAHWERKAPSDEQAYHPVVYVSLDDAVAYCQWLSAQTGRTWRLPSEAEWEKAARGTDGRYWPWGGDLPDRSRCNFGWDSGTTTPVDKYGQLGASPYGCADMAGNVWEWTSSIFAPYPYDADDGREDADSCALRILRGGSFSVIEFNLRCACRHSYRPDSCNGRLGFRVVAAPSRGALPRSR